MVLGGGPNRIGQGIEFDYCCVHAAFAMREEGYETIMVNCNPETVSTDYDTSDRLYFESLTLEDVLEIIHVEKPSGIIVQYGGQTPLKLARALEAEGAPIIGTSPDSIDLAEDRERFQQMVEKLNLLQPPNRIARTASEASELAKEIDKTEKITAYEPPKAAEKPAVKRVVPSSPVPIRTPVEKEKEGGGLIKQIFSSLFGGGSKEQVEEPAPAAKPEARQPRRSSGRGKTGQSTSGRGRGGRQRRGGQQRQQSQSTVSDKQDQPASKEEGKRETTSQTDNRPKPANKEREKSSRPRRNGRNQGRRQGSRDKAAANQNQNANKQGETVSGVSPQAQASEPSKSPVQEQSRNVDTTSTGQQPNTAAANNHEANRTSETTPQPTAPIQRESQPKREPAAVTSNVLLQDKPNQAPISAETSAPMKPDFPQSSIHSAVSNTAGASRMDPPKQETPHQTQERSEVRNDSQQASPKRTQDEERENNTLSQQ